jgi:hypothetical protein
MEVTGANRRWRLQFLYRGSRRESARAQLSTLGIRTQPPQSRKGKMNTWSFSLLATPLEND